MTSPLLARPSMIARVVEREWHVYRRMWRGNAFTMFVQPALFLGAMGIGVGGLVDDEGTAALGGLTYLQFVVPGLLVASSMLASAGDGLWGVMAGTKWMGHFVGLTSTPMSPADVYGGVLGWMAVRSCMGAVPFLAIGAVAGGVPSWWGVLAVVPAVLTSVLAVASLSAYSVRRQDDFTFPLIMRLGILPLFLFSGTFFPVSQLPDILQPLSWLSPLWHASEAARAATTGSFDIASIGHVTLLVALIVVVWPIGARGFVRRLHP